MIHKKKHLVLKSHDSHKGMIALMTTILVVVVVTLFYKMLDLTSITDTEFRILVIVLLITLNITFLVFAAIVTHFFIEVKDKYMED